MPPQWFTFGIPNYFQFTFRHRPGTPSLVGETVDVKSDAKDVIDPNTGNRVMALISSSSEDTYFPPDSAVKTLVSSPSFSTGKTASSPCGTLGRLPLELGMMIYKMVLALEKWIRNAHKFLDRHQPIMAKEATYIESIDAALLRTCRTVYPETLQILYGRNIFDFRKAEDIKKLSHD